MKIFSRILSLLVISTLGLFYAGCGGSSSDPDPAEKIQLAKLSKTWTLDAGANAATLDDVDRTSSFKNFTLKLEGTFSASAPKGPYKYTTAGTEFPSPSPWIVNTFSFWSFSSVEADGSGGVIVTTEGITMNYKFTATGLKLSFNCAACNFNARVEEVNGPWVFNFH